MIKKQVLKRYILFIFGLFFIALGVAFAKSAELGVSPISSVANVLSIKFPAISMGLWLTLWNCLLLIGQILILRRRFKPIQLLQIPLSFLFGYFTDFGMWLLSFIPIKNYSTQIIFTLTGVVIVGLGVSVSVTANVIMNSGEAFVKVVADELGKNFGNVKIVFDVSCVACSVIISLLLFDFTIVGAREGTVIAAFITGLAAKFFSSKLTKPLNDLVAK